MAGKLGETMTVVQAVKPASYGAGTTYNGAANASGLGIDTRDYDEALVIVNCGVAASTATLDITLVETNDNTANANLATSVSGAAFTQITDANHNTVYVGNVRCKGRNRYLIVKSVAGTAATIYGVTVVLSKADSVSTGQTLSFTV